MKTLVLCEKISQVKNVMKSYPEAFKKGELVGGFYFTYVGSPFVFPNKIKYADLPFTKEPEYKLITGDCILDGKESYMSKFFVINEDLTYTNEDQVSQEHFIDYESRKKYLGSFDRIVVATDSDHPGEFGARTFLRMSGVFESQTTIERLIMLGSNDVKGISKSWKKLFSLDDEFPLALYNYGRIKRYFDYNFNMMSNIIFNDLIRHVESKNGGETFTKYQMMVLHLLSKNSGLTRYEFLEFLYEYQGTGKFTTEDGRIGTHMSRPMIVEHLVNLGFAEIEKEKIRVSEKGQCFLSLLHDKTFDPDLHLRLEDWGLNFTEDNFSKIDRYLKTLFGKQIRFQAKFIHN